jgi:hypothetical protein
LVFFILNPQLPNRLIDKRDIVILTNPDGMAGSPLWWVFRIVEKVLGYDITG